MNKLYNRKDSAATGGIDNLGSPILGGSDNECR